MTAAEWVAQRRELLDDATEGPWGATYGPGELARVWTDALDDVEALATITGFTRQADGAPDALLIADARTSLPRALDALEAVLALADNPYPDARNISGADIKRAIEAALRGDS